MISLALGSHKNSSSSPKLDVGHKRGEINPPQAANGLLMPPPQAAEIPPAGQEFLKNPFQTKKKVTNKMHPPNFYENFLIFCILNGKKLCCSEVSTNFLDYKSFYYFPPLMCSRGDSKKSFSKFGQTHPLKWQIWNKKAFLDHNIYFPKEGGVKQYGKFHICF